MFQTIVVGTDGSKGALEAIAAAGDLAKSLGVPSIHIVASCPALTGQDMSRIKRSLPDEFHDLVSPHMSAADRFYEAADILRPLGVAVVDHERSGDPAEAILTVADEIDADLVVVGARGLGAIGRFFRGSVSTKVAHHSPCSVLIVEHND